MSRPRNGSSAPDERRGNQLCRPYNDMRDIEVERSATG